MYGRQVNTGQHLIVSYDRSTNSFHRTLRKMGIAVDTINFYRPSRKEAQRPVVEFLGDLLKRQEYRNVSVLIVEGADMKVLGGKINDLAAVSDYADDLQRFAERLGIHLILTLGTGKMRPKDKYLSLRERIIGSTGWGRKLETIVYVEPNEKNDALREVTILTRNAPDERHTFEFKNGRLTEIIAGSTKAKLEHWMSTELKPGEPFTLETAQAAIKAPKSTVQSALTQLVGEGKVEKPEHGIYKRPVVKAGDDGAEKNAQPEPVRAGCPERHAADLKGMDVFGV